MSAIMLAYISYMGVYFIVLQGLFLGLCFIKKPRILSCILFMYLIILLGYSPWIGFYFDALIKQGPTWIPTPHYAIILQHYYSYHMQVFFRFFHFFQMQAIFLLIMATMLFCVLYYKYFLSAKYYLANSSGAFIIRIQEFIKSSNFLDISFATKFLILWAVIPYAVVYFKSIVSQPILITRAMIFIIPAIYLLEARAISKIKFNKIEKRLIVFIVSIFLSFQTYNYYTAPNKEQYREAAFYVAKEDQELNSILTCGDSAFGLNYYLKKFDVDKKCYKIHRKSINQLQEKIQTNNPQYLWLLSAHKQLSSEFLNSLQKKLHLKFIRHKKFIGADVYLYENLN